MKFENVLITGASSGIGKALAEEFAKKELNLILLARNQEAMKSIAEKFPKADIRFVRCDVTKQEDVRNAVSFAYSSFGKIDLAILNSGIEENTFASNFKTEVIRQVMEVNTFGITYFIEELLPRMKQTGGTIAGVTSLADSRSFPGSSAYCASKAASSYILESLRSELHGTNINIVTIKPGFVRTAMTDDHEYYMPFIIDADKSAKIIISGLEKGKNRIYFPAITVFLTYLMDAMPDSMWDFIASIGARFKLKKNRQ